MIRVINYYRFANSPQNKTPHAIYCRPHTRGMVRLGQMDAVEENGGSGQVMEGEPKNTWPTACEWTRVVGTLMVRGLRYYGKYM